MKSSSKIQITLLASVAAAMAGCNSSKPPRRCVDASNKVVLDGLCPGGATSSFDGPGNGGGVGYVPYHWYYGGPRGFVPLGAFVSGGSTSAPRGGYSTSTPTSRGGIGAAGEAASGHGGGGGGAGE